MTKQSGTGQWPIGQTTGERNGGKRDKRLTISVVPVLAIGFEDIQKRITSQEQQTAAYRLRMHEVVKKLTELANVHELSTSVRVQEAQIKHIELSRRSLNLAIKVQIVKSRGYSLRPEEERLKTRLLELSKRLNDPAVFGRINEIWARMTLIRDQLKALDSQDGGGKAALASINGIEWTRDQQQLEIIAKVLQDQQTSIAYVSKVLQDDMREVQELVQETEPAKPA